MKRNLILNFFYSHPCSYCGIQDRHSEVLGLCKFCLKLQFSEQKVWQKQTLCRSCFRAKLTENSDLCISCEERFVFWSQFSALRLRGSFERTVFEFCKFGNDKQLCHYFSLGLSRVIRVWKHDLPDTLALVPSKKKKGMNPFHPASVLIPRLRRKWGDKPILNIKKISDKKQSGENYENRFFHAKTSFLVQKNDRMIAGRHIMLIDDISTTGASLNELACELLRLGAKKVSCLVLLLSEGYT